MKKLMTALLCALGFSLVSQAEGSISGTNFEGLSVGFEVIGKTDDGSLNGGYWSNTVESVEALVATNTFTMVEVPPQEEGGDPTYDKVFDIVPYSGTVGYPSVHGNADSENYLSINTKGGELVRNIQEGGSAQSIDGGIYFDSMVQFTATDALDANAGSESDKLILWLRDNGNGTTNLVVTAGYLNDEFEAVKTDYAIVNAVQADKWYRLTIQAITNAISFGQYQYVGYAVYIDGVKAEFATTTDAFASNYIVSSPYSNYLYNENVHALFPSLVGYGMEGAETFTAVAFSGVGAVDDIEFTRTAPDFANPPASLTVEWTVGVDTVTIDPDEGEEIVIAANGVAGSTNITDKGTYTITATVQTGYVAATVSQSAVTVANTEVTVNVSTVEGFAEINGTLYATLADAVAAVGANGTVKLYQNNDMGDTALTVANADAFVLDLNGKILSGADDAVVVVGSAMTIIDSIGGGAVSNTTAEAVAVIVDGGSLVIGYDENDMGASFYGMVGPNGEETFRIVRGNFYSDDEDSIGGFVAQGSVGNDIEGCYVVAPDTGVKVAQIGETTYETLAEAIAAAKNGDTVKILTNITLDTRVEPNLGGSNALTIDLGGYTLSRTGTSGNGSVFDVKSGNVVITNGVIDCTQDDTDIAKDGVYAITSRSGSNVTLADLTITVDSECGACAYPFAGSTMTIESGTYANVTTTPYRYNTAITGMAVNQPNNATQNLIIRGGSFSKYDPQLGDDSGNMTDFTAAGFVAIQDGSGNWVVQAGYNVTFDVNGGSPAPAAQRVAAGGTATEPTEPTKEDYTFTGWFASGAETAFDFDTVLDGDLVLTAVWEQDAPATPTVDGDEVDADKVFDNATSASVIVYPTQPTTAKNQDGTTTVTLNNQDSTVPAYYDVTVTQNGDGKYTVALELNDTALPEIDEAVIAEETKPAMEVTDNATTVTLKATNERLYYGLASADSANTPKDDYVVPATLTKGNGHAMQITIPVGSNETSKFYRVYVTDIAPAQSGN